MGIPFITLCMIVKNEEKVLRRCLDSVKEHVNEIIIVDTGSEDSTRKIAEEYTPKIYEYKWNSNFSDARNFAASKATGKWILVLDADEYVDPNNLKEAIININQNSNMYDIYAVNIINFAGNNGENIAQHRHVRIYRNDNTIEFFRSIHEQLRKKDKSNVNIGLSELMIYHSGYLSKTIKEKKKNSRNRNLIEKELIDSDNAFDFFNLGNEFRIIGETQKALEAYIKAFKKKDEFDIDWIPFCLCNMVECLIYLERFNDALTVIDDAMNIYENTADFIYLKGHVYLSQHRYDDAKSIFLNIISNKDKLHNIIKSPDYRDYFPFKRLGLIFELEKDYENAIIYYIQALNNNKHCLESSVHLIKILSKFHSENEIYQFFSENILSNNKEFNKKILIYALNQGLAVFSEQLNAEYNIITWDQDLFHFKSNIINGNFNLDTQVNIKTTSLLHGLSESLIDAADLLIYYLNIRNVSKDNRIKVLITQSNLSTILGELINEQVDITTIDTEGFLYIIEKCLIYQQFDILNQLMDLKKLMKVNISNRIANVFYSRGYNDESIEFYESADEDSLNENDFCQIVEWLISKGDLQTAKEIAETANKRFSGDFRFYKYILQLCSELEINYKEFFYKTMENFKDSEWLKDFYNSQINNKSGLGQMVSCSDLIQNNEGIGQKLELKEKKNDSIHIVYVLNHVRITGGTKIILEHANRLKKQGMSVTIVSHYPRPIWFIVDVDYIEVPVENQLSSGIVDCDIIVATYWDQIQYCINLSKAPVVYFEQGDFHLFKGKTPAHLEDFIYEQLQLPIFILTVSNRAAALIKSKFNREAIVIQNAVDKKVFNNKKDSSNLLNIRESYLLMMGSDKATFKGLKDIINAVKLVKKVINIKLYWITPNDPTDEMKENVDRIFVAPSQESIASLFKGASLFISASHYETFSLPVLEAMACGCPVVTTGNEGVLEYAKDNFNVLITKIGSYYDISEKILVILNNNELRDKLILNGITTAKEFDWDVITFQLLKFYRDVALYQVKNKKNELYEHSIEGAINNMYGVYIGDNKMLLKTIWGGKLITSNRDMSLMPELIVNGVIEVPLTKYFINNIKEGDVVIDVGANIGYYTIMLGRQVGDYGKVIAFEANESTYSLLMDNVAINYLQGRVKTVNKAVYSSNQEIAFFTTERFNGNASIHKPNNEYFDYFLVDKGMEEKIVPAISLDSYIGEKEVVDYIKIDIEGGEYHCLLGMQELIKSYRVKTIIFELNKLRSKKDSEKLYDLLMMFHKEYKIKYGIINNEGIVVEFPLEQIFNYDFIPSVVMSVLKE